MSNPTTPGSRAQSEPDVRGEHDFQQPHEVATSDEVPRLTRRPGDYAAGADGTQNVTPGPDSETQDTRETDERAGDRGQR
jgi:hypothetical protein